MSEVENEKAIADAVAAERKRCLEWARAMRMGQIDDIRSVILGIQCGSIFPEDEEDNG